MQSISDCEVIRVVGDFKVEFAASDVAILHGEDGFLYASFHSLCQILGMDFYDHLTQLKQHAILRDGYRKGLTSEERHSSQEFELLRLDFLAFWLANLDLIKVSPLVRQEVESLQREAALVLQEAFLSGRLTDSLRLSELLENDTLAIRAYKETITLVSLARCQAIREANSGLRLKT